jgi:hypothetical protein
VPAWILGHGFEVEHLGVEPLSNCDVAYVEHRMVQAFDRQLLPLRWNQDRAFTAARALGLGLIVRP